MATWTPDPTFYPSPRLATQAPPEKLAYVASFDPTRKRPDVMAVVDLDSQSAGYGRILGSVSAAAHVRDVFLPYAVLNSHDNQFTTVVPTEPGW
jgi:hypothetical protein